MSRFPTLSGILPKRNNVLTEPLTSLEGIGPKKAAVLKEEAAIETIEDLLYYSPRKYLDRSNVKKIKDCFINETVSVIGKIESTSIGGKGKKFLEVVISDDTDSITGVFFGGVQYFKKTFIPGEEIIFSGKIQFYRQKQIVHPDFDFIDEESILQTINTAAIIPLYKSTEKLRTAGLDSRGLRRLFRQAFDHYLPLMQDTLPDEILKRRKLTDIKTALFNIHFPSTFKDAEEARRRLAFNELFFLFFYLRFSRSCARHIITGNPMKDKGNILASFTADLPYELTADQVQAVKEISHNLQDNFPMNRLLQGDVGSGKTVVALAAALISVSAGFQAAFMAPTSVLARQHFLTMKKLLPEGISAPLLTGQTSQEERKKILEGLAAGEINIICGTHALIQDTVEFKSLGLIVIDEQHRFGVNQRAALRAKGEHPHLLVMTATPIPRSLAMTVYGDLEVSMIKNKPLNRGSIQTISLPVSRLPGVYNSIKKYIEQGRQIYYILPLIEESKKSDLKAANTVYTHLKDDIFTDTKVGLLHGRMKGDEKEVIMDRFRKGEIDILVSTSVIEVGIDVPNANVIIIEHPERFGLSQLHQLRGRVGRAEYDSFCILLYPEDISPESHERINILVNTEDGFVIAEEDLKTRGAGQLLGTRQHGADDFEFTSLSSDMELIKAAREEAEREVEKTDSTIKPEDINNSLRSASLLTGIRQKRIFEILS